ncbi:MAG: 4-hydroxy-3-methylbut-2-enyl diphosphate reductase [Pyrinomonadaceae bacterium]
MDAALRAAVAVAAARDGRGKYLIEGIAMQVLLAEEFGFCFGVERAVEMVEDALAQGARVRTLGPLIHNTQEIQRLESHGVTTIDAPADIEGNVTAVIRAHGVTPQVQRELESRAAKVVDATCPFVTKVQKLAERAAAEGRDVVVVGNPDHPEMIGVVGYAPNNSHVVRDASEVANLPPLLRAPLVVSQTTIKLSTFLEAAEAVRAKSDAEPQIVNTICSATRDRQDAARALAGHVDAFYIIGGRHSSNSLKLLSVCREQCERSFLIETPEEIEVENLRGVARVGVTAGASTPNWLIDQVVARLREIGDLADAYHEPATIN